MRLLTCLAAAAVAAGLLSGCSEDDDPETASSSTASTAPTDPTTETASTPPPSPSPSETAVDVETEILDRFDIYTTAFFAGDPATAYDLLSDRCRETTPLSEFASNSEQAASLYGALEPTIDSVEVDGDKATVEATFGVPAIDGPADKPNFVLERGDWYVDAC